MSLSTGQAVSRSGTGAFTGGSYTATPGGLTIDAVTGAITPSTSTAGTYTVTYTIPSSGGCSAVPVATSVTITAVPTASISYPGAPFCKSLSTGQTVTLSGTGAFIGGSYTATSGGLTIDAGTGAITPSTSTAGNYTVTYTIPASGGCSTVPVTTSVTITAVPTATISYAGTPFCKSLSTGQLVTRSGTGAFTGGTYTATSGGLTIDAVSGTITPSTSTAGNYTVTYTIPASGGCATVPVTTSVTVSPLTIGGTASANQIICSGSTAAAITLTGNTGSVVKWQKASNPAFTVGLANISNTTTTLPSATIGTINSSTYFRAVVQSSPCSIAYSSTVLIAIDSTISSPITASPATTICLGEPLTLSTTGYQSRDSIMGGDFSQANPPGWSGDNANNSNGEA